jgi:hypothetical protein
MEDRPCKRLKTSHVSAADVFYVLIAAVLSSVSCTTRRSREPVHVEMLLYRGIPRFFLRYMHALLLNLAAKAVARGRVPLLIDKGDPAPPPICQDLY